MAGKILIVDDDPVVVNALNLRLKFSGFETIVRFDGESGLEAAREYQPDAILVDRQMPDMDGIDAIALLKADRTTRAIPAIMVSGTETDRSAALDAGAVAFVSKPYQSETLLAAIRQAMKEHRVPAGA